MFPNCVSNLTVPPVKLRGIIQLGFFQMEEGVGSKKKNYFFFFAIFWTLPNYCRDWDWVSFFFFFLSNSNFSRSSVGWWARGRKKVQFNLLVETRKIQTTDLRNPIPSRDENPFLETKARINFLRFRGKRTCDAEGSRLAQPGRCNGNSQCSFVGGPFMLKSQASFRKQRAPMW